MARLQWQRKHARTRQSRNDHENVGLCLQAIGFRHVTCSPKFSPVGWCLHEFSTHISRVKTQESARTCVYVCAHFHTSMACVCKSSSAERRAVQAGSEHSSALTSVCTPSSGNGILRRRTEAVVSADGGRHSGNEHSSAHASFLESICMHARRRIPVCVCVCVRARSRH